MKIRKKFLWPPDPTPSEEGDTFSSHSTPPPPGLRPLDPRAAILSELALWLLTVVNVSANTLVSTQQKNMLLGNGY